MQNRKAPQSDARLADDHMLAVAAGQRQVARGGTHVDAGGAQAQRLRYAARERRAPVRRSLTAIRSLTYQYQKPQCQTARAQRGRKAF